MHTCAGSIPASPTTRANSSMVEQHIQPRELARMTLCWHVPYPHNGCIHTGFKPTGLENQSPARDSLCDRNLCGTWHQSPLGRARPHQRSLHSNFQSGNAGSNPVSPSGGWSRGLRRQNLNTMLRELTRPAILDTQNCSTSHWSPMPSPRRGGWPKAGRGSENYSCTSVRHVIDCLTGGVVRAPTREAYNLQLRVQIPSPRPLRGVAQ